MRATSYRLLTRHFFTTLFDFGVLSDVGSESFKRVLLGAAAVVLALGLLLVRVFLGKYADLANAPALDYQRALLADHAFLVALPMWLVASAVVLIGHSLFPDENDFRVLMVHPVPRSTVFAAKLTALLLFGGLVVIAAHVALFPLLAVTLLHRHAETSFFVSVPVHWVTSAAASAFAALSVVAIHGVLVLLAPRARLVVVAATVRSAMLCVLVLVLPLLARLPAIAGPFASHAAWLTWVPPAWFVAAQRWCLGDASHTALAARAPFALLTVAAISAGVYLVLYRRFDRLTVRPGTARRGQLRRWMVAPLAPGRAVRGAVVQFTAITLRRSVLHQGIVVTLLAAGLGLAANTLLATDLPQALGEPSRIHRGLQPVVAGAMFAWMFIAVPSVRLTLAVPVEARANWIFRMTEDPEHRADATGAAVLTVGWLGVAAPVAIMLPLQWLVSGRQAFTVGAVALVIGWLLVEVRMRDWPRIPFTSSYVPGKGFVPQMFVKAVGTFLMFTTFATAATQVAVQSPIAGTVLVAIAAATATLLVVRRRRVAATLPLAFEDELPTEISPLRLND